VPWKQHKEVAVDLKAIYQLPTAEKGEMELTAFKEKWNKTHPSIGKS